MRLTHSTLQRLRRSDGSIVYLNARSRIRVDFSREARDVELDQGEAVFKVAHDTARPFRVHAAGAIASRADSLKLEAAAELVEQKVSETLTYYKYPSTHWRQIRTNNQLERIIREIRRRTRVVGIPGWPLGTDARSGAAARS